jgi:hypothetical protein
VRVPPGRFLGSLQWHGADGLVKRVIVRQAARSNSIRVDGMRREIGWDELLKTIRRVLSVKKALFS